MPTPPASLGTTGLRGGRHAAGCSNRATPLPGCHAMTTFDNLSPIDPIIPRATWCHAPIARTRRARRSVAIRTCTFSLTEQRGACRIALPSPASARRPTRPPLFAGHPWSRGPLPCVRRLAAMRALPPSPPPPIRNMPEPCLGTRPQHLDAKRSVLMRRRVPVDKRQSVAPAAYARGCRPDDE